MKERSLWRRRLSSGLAAFLLFGALSPGLTAAAEDTASATETQTEARTQASTGEASQPDATGEASVPEETTQASETTASSEAATEASPETTASSEAASGEAAEAEEILPPEGSSFSLTPDTLWYPVSLEEILPTDILALTITDGAQTWALSSENGGQSAPAAIAVEQENGVMRSSGSGLNWKLVRETEGLILCPEDGSGHLYADKGSDSLRIGSLGAPYWEQKDNTLFHRLSRRYLWVNGETGTWQTPAEADPAQTLSFWRKPRTAPVTASPAGGAVAPGAEITLSCAGAEAAIYYALSEDGLTYSEFTAYSQPISVPEAFAALYVKAYTSSEAAPASPETVFTYTREAAPEAKPDWALPYDFYFGQLHAHTAVSDGKGTANAAFQAAREEGLDFFAVTEHSDSLENAASGSLAKDGTQVSGDWAEGKAAAAAATDESFVGIYGFEMSWPQGKNLGHIVTFATPGWQTWKQEGFGSLESYYQALSEVSASIGQFSHPGDLYGDFEDFSHRTAAADRHMALLEVGGEGDFRAYGAYTHALDKGWHVSPTNNQSTHDGAFASGEARTVILANSLSESSLYSAIRDRRVYATDDRDLEVYFTLNGHAMGSILPAADSPVLHAYLYDPTDAKLGRVEVISDGGAVLVSETVEKNWAELELSLPAGHSYYYLRITQADGDTAVTAPVWMEDYRDAGIQSFTAQPGLAVQSQPVSLTVELFNEETAALTVHTLEFFLDGESIHLAASPGVAEPGGTLSYTLPYTHCGLGAAKFHVTAVGTIGGLSRSYEAELTLSYHGSQQTGNVLIDGSHGNFCLGALSRFSALAAEADMTTTVFPESLPWGGKLLVVSAPENGAAFRKDFTEEVSAFLKSGGSLLLLGQKENTEALNGLLSELGSTMGLGGAVPDLQNPARYQQESPYSGTLWKRQFYYHADGCAVLPGEGTWLVRHPETGDALLACEAVGGGMIFLSGASFLSDRDLPVPDNQWDAPSANQGILEAILGTHQERLPLRTIEEARSGEIGEIFRIRGYATTGTSDPHTTIPNTLCLQDDTGGIPIVDFADTGIAVGICLDVIGQRQEQGGNIVLTLIDYSLPEEDPYRYVPRTRTFSTATDYAARGGELVQVEGTVADFLRTSSGQGISRLVLEDYLGRTVTVVIGENIASGSTGRNNLTSQVKQERTFRAMGILYLDKGSPILRVRNCEEVVYVPPTPDRTNPRVGDSGFVCFAGMVMSATGLAVLTGRRRRRGR